MTKGLTIWKDADDNSIFLDADNAFWGIAKLKNNNFNASGLFIPRDALSLYGNFKDKLDKEFYDFRFSQELSAIYIDPTDRCNASCLYCYIPAKTRRDGRSMTKGELNFILNKIASFFRGKKRKPVIVFHASEPLLVKGVIFDAIDKYKKVFKFGLQTNAILLEEKDVSFLKKNRVGVGISLDSFSPLVNNRLRPAGEIEGNFSSAVRAIECFAGYKGLNVITTITRINVKDLPAIIEFLHARKVPCLLLNPVRLTQKSSRNLKPDNKIMAKYFLKAVDTAMVLSKKTKHKIIVGNFANTLLAIIAPLARRLMCDISPCGGGRCFFTITAQGKMIPCGEFIGIKGFSGGNIFKTTISEAMQSKAFIKIRERFVEKIKECNVCEFRNICGAPCPAELHSLGQMYQKSVFCDFYKKVIKYAFKVIAENKIRYFLRQDSLRNLRYHYKLNAGQ